MVLKKASITVGKAQQQMARAENLPATLPSKSRKKESELEVKQALNFQSLPPLMYFCQQIYTSQQVLHLLRTVLPPGDQGFKYIGLWRQCSFKSLQGHRLEM